MLLYREEYKQKDAQGNLATQSIDSTWMPVPTVGTHTPARPVADCRFCNPFRPGSSIICQAPEPYAPIQLKIINKQGRIVAHDRIMPGDNSTPAIALEAGLYYIGIWQNGKYLGQKKMIVN
jgi:hypothetical protein